MPELPEVQTIVSDLNKKIIGRRIIGVWFDTPKMISLFLKDNFFKDKPKALRKDLLWKNSGLIKGTPGKKEEFKKIFEREIKGLKITRIERRGKNILIYLTDDRGLGADGYLLLIHQKLTGHLLYGKWKIKKTRNSKFEVRSLIKGPLEEIVNDYIHLIFYLDNGWQLALSDLRKFAKILFGPKEKIENLSDLVKIGPEPLERGFAFNKFLNLMRFRRGKIKQVLMDQEVIAGIGNIYSDEILWQAKINPLRKVNELRFDELKRVYWAMKQILKKAIKLRGTSISDYRDTEGKSGNYAEVRYVYQREGEPCRRCKTLIKRVKINGRSAHYCPSCQKI